MDEESAVRVQSASDFAGVPDAIQRLWTPHRMAYIDGENKPVPGHDTREDGQPSCPFCRVPAQDDAEALIVHRGRTCFVVLNLYPYAPGHVLVCPYRHVPLYTDLTADELSEFGLLTQRAMHVLSRVMHPQGFNIGMNQGEAGGAGIAAHLHQHVVPRWVGDSNFMPLIGHTRPMPQLLGDTRELLATHWDAAPEQPAPPGGATPERPAPPRGADA